MQQDLKVVSQLYGVLLHEREPQLYTCSMLRVGKTGLVNILDRLFADLS